MPAQIEKRTELYSGKAKTVYTTSDEKKLILHFRDDTSAFDGEKVEQLERKGRVNNQFNAFIMQTLQDDGVATHFGEVDRAAVWANPYPITERKAGSQRVQ